MDKRFAGIDVGAETIKYVIVKVPECTIMAYQVLEHHKCMSECLEQVFGILRERQVEGCAVCGRFANHLEIRHYPKRAVQTRGLDHQFGAQPLTYITIGCNGFSVLEKRGHGADIFRENSRCSQGTGNFLRQLVERFDKDLPTADKECEHVTDACALSGRCPVILKTDMTHLANRGESQARILAGVYDAICQNVEALVKTSICPHTVLLSGGVTRSKRIRQHFAEFCQKHGLELLPENDISQHYIEALGCACLAAEMGASPIPEAGKKILTTSKFTKFDRISPLSDFLPKVRRMPPTEIKPLTQPTDVWIGFDIGSTGSKAVAITAGGDLNDVIWEGYIRTNGNPVAAANTLLQNFVHQKLEHARIIGFGVTGSGREIVGSMLATCFGQAHVYVMNEIAAHAEGARSIDPRVDTIFEIGGQDAKYMRLSDGKIVDSAMNEACSAGTGSFIEEQGKKFKNIHSLEHLAELALNAPYGVSLGQHCSVFMTQVIEDAVASGIDTAAILAGIYDSVILNYFYRVKGNRSVGNVVFCQGMPFSSDALACAVVRQTHAEVIIPPNPGTIGAFGIAKLAQKFRPLENTDPLDLSLFLNARLIERKTFNCTSNKGCGGAGNHCKIEKISVQVNQQKLNFTWGGACSLWDRGTTIQKLPDRAPDPFRTRAELVMALIHKLPARGKQHKTIAIAEEFQNKTFFVFFAAFLYHLGYDLKIFTSEGLDDLKRGLDESNVQFCAPMQHYHGMVSRMNASDADLLFLPMMRSGNFTKNEAYAVICPIVQSSADLFRHDLAMDPTRILSPIIDLGPGNLKSEAFINSCQNLAQMLHADNFEDAFAFASKEFIQFEAQLKALGREALNFAKEHQIPAIVVLGRNYTIHNNALNSNVPALLRTQGAMAIPIDCYPVDEAEPLYTNTYWSYGQINLRAATQIRKTPGIYSVWCSNYACGPDSFNLHFYQYIMYGKPYVIIETDGHSGDAGTKTRIEAFLHCVREFESGIPQQTPKDLHILENQNVPLFEAYKKGASILIPQLGDNTQIIAAGFESIGIKCVPLPVATRRTLLLGRRHTSGKECLPALITLGALLEYAEDHPDEKIVFFMPRSNGPCRLGCYNLLDKMVIEKLGLADRVQIWSMTDTDYSEGVPIDLFVAIYMAFIACDMLMAGLYHVRPVEKTPGIANAIYKKHLDRILNILRQYQSKPLWQLTVAREILSKHFFGLPDIVQDCARELAEVKTDKKVPTVCVTGEIFVRNEAFTNDFIIDALEKRGMRVLFSHFTEWIEYADIINHEILKTANSLTEKITSRLTRYALQRFYQPMEAALGWSKRHDVHHILAMAQPYLRPELVGEEILTIGTPLTAYKHKQIQGVVSVGPLECMPSKIAESQFYHIAENEGLPSLCLSFNGDPIPDSVLDDFCFTVKKKFAEQCVDHETRFGRMHD